MAERWRENKGEGGEKAVKAEGLKRRWRQEKKNWKHDSHFILILHIKSPTD